mmetsp:Transcript_45116/g.98073  ORF Transcript_45116/g.98073 Transcript_45116/m.98073 type:complete len:225 (+) Transcript_45116:655-1329(+)
MCADRCTVSSGSSRARRRAGSVALSAASVVSGAAPVAAATASPSDSANGIDGSMSSSAVSGALSTSAPLRSAISAAAASRSAICIRTPSEAACVSGWAATSGSPEGSGNAPKGTMCKNECGMSVIGVPGSIFPKKGFRRASERCCRSASMSPSASAWRARSSDTCSSPISIPRFDIGCAISRSFSITVQTRSCSGNPAGASAGARWHVTLPSARMSQLRSSAGG